MRGDALCLWLFSFMFVSKKAAGQSEVHACRKASSKSDQTLFEFIVKRPGFDKILRFLGELSLISITVVVSQ